MKFEKNKKNVLKIGNDKTTILYLNGAPNMF